VDAGFLQAGRQLDVGRFVEPARSSTMTVTSLPRRAASTRLSTISESAPARYSVILIASTRGSDAAWRTKSVTGWKDW